MAFKTALLATALAFAAATSASAAVYTDEAAFNAAFPGATQYTFSFTGTEFSGATYTLGPVTFTSANSTVGGPLLQSYHDAYGVPSGTVPYLGSYGALLTVSTTSSFLGLHLGSYSGEQIVSYSFGETSGTLDVPAPNQTAFIGFGFTGPASGPLTVSFSNDLELDTISFSSGATVPEPASWALMLAGFGLVGFAARRRQAVAA